MPHTHYMVRKRCKINGIDGPVNLPYATLVEAVDNTIMYRGKRICFVTSDNGCKYFSHNDDGMAAIRGAYVQSILDALAQSKKTKENASWKKVCNDSKCLEYRKPAQDDFFLWDWTFYQAPIEDLEYINNLVGGNFHV